MRPPLVGVVARAVAAGGVESWPTMPAAAVPMPYVRALQAAGGLEAIIAPTADGDPLAQGHRLERLDGLLLIGGGDVDPACYGHANRGEVYGTDRVRDEFEIALVRAAGERRLPTLAICRGLQVANVALGGTLADLPASALEQHGDPQRWRFARHDIVIEKGSLLAETLDTTGTDVPSLHHQVVDKVGEGLQIVASGLDGAPEALACAGAPLLAVQWHPEAEVGSGSVQQRLFDWLVAAASGRA